MSTFETRGSSFGTFVMSFGGLHLHVVLGGHSKRYDYLDRDKIDARCLKPRTSILTGANNSKKYWALFVRGYP